MCFRNLVLYPTELPGLCNLSISYNFSSCEISKHATPEKTYYPFTAVIGDSTASGIVAELAAKAVLQRTKSVNEILSVCLQYRTFTNGEMGGTRIVLKVKASLRRHSFGCKNDILATGPSSELNATKASPHFFDVARKAVS